jgi:DNA-binding beta-propeller fold protein YncE
MVSRHEGSAVRAIITNVVTGGVVPLGLALLAGALPACSEGGARPAPGGGAPEGSTSVSQASGGSADTMRLSDEPGNWFKSDATGTSVSFINQGQRVDFVINDCCTSTRHTVTLLVKPDGSTVTMDQGEAQSGSLQATFDVPGVYVFVCKIHPYMTAVVAVRDSAGNVPPVTATSLPLIGHLGASSLPPAAVLSVLRPIAATDADKAAKWDLFAESDPRLGAPAVPGVGEVWVSSQFERVPGQVDEHGVGKPGTITVIDAASFAVEREINGLGADHKWNNPHNMWANERLDTVYNGNWFGRWINKIDRVSGAIGGSVTVGQAPTHIITNPDQSSPQAGVLSVPLSAEDNIVKVADDAGGFRVIDSKPTGAGSNHPHGHWLTCGDGHITVVPNVFKGVGLKGSVSFLDTLSGAVIQEISYSASDPLRKALLMPLAVGECHVDDVHKAYVANAVSGYVSVFDVASRTLTKNLPVTLTPDNQTGFDLTHTLQVPIQTPVSPDGKWVATAVLSLTTAARSATGSADHVAIIDARTDQILKRIGTPGGTHGINWGARQGGGYYAYVTSQFSNVLTVIDPDPDGDDDGSDAAIVGRIRLANGSAGAGVTDGTGGQGVKPLPMVHDGWIQPTVALVGTGQLSAEVEGWIAALTAEQKAPH